MDSSTWVAALVAAVVSVAVTVGFRWWDRACVWWVLIGEAHLPYDAGRKLDALKFTATLHNAGNGTAYDVRSRRRIGPQYDDWESFEAAIVRPGESVTLTQQSNGAWDDLEIDLSWSVSPRRSYRQRRVGRGRRQTLALRPSARWNYDGDTSGSTGARPRLPDRT